MGGKMTKKIVIRDKQGFVINIGDWDYMEENLIDSETGEVTSTIKHNPLPEGATSSEEHIITLPDGGLSAENAEAN